MRNAIRTAYFPLLEFGHPRLTLQTTSLTVAQIADRLHFADTTTFARFFKRLKGCTPKEYRQQKQ